MVRPFHRVVLAMLYDLDATEGEPVDPDQVLLWMQAVAEAIGQLDPAERREFIDGARQMADEAARGGDDDRAAAYARVADAEEAGT
jgi:hypothetical protein